MNPTPIPVAILCVSGVRMIIRKAGNVSSRSFQLILLITLIMKYPTIISAGEVIAGIPDITLTIGVKNNVSASTVTAVNPVLPPAATLCWTRYKPMLGWFRARLRSLFLRHLPRAHRVSEGISVFQESCLFSNTQHRSRCIKQRD